MAHTFQNTLNKIQCITQRDLIKTMYIVELFVANYN